jgi:multicomponent Na+:H+ antiporter subunit A
MAQRHLELADEAHGKDVVTVILADFRGLDTLVEVSVVAVAMLGVLMLLRRGRA